MVSRAKIGISLHSSSIFQTLVLGVANYLVVALEPPNTLRYESSNYAHRPSLSSLQPSRQNSFSARQRSLQRACVQASPSFLLDTLHWLSHTSSVAYRFCLSSFQTRHATSLTVISILGSFFLLRFVVKVILQITFTLLRYLFWFAVLCAILLCVL